MVVLTVGNVLLVITRVLKDVVSDFSEDDWAAALKYVRRGENVAVFGSDVVVMFGSFPAEMMDENTIRIIKIYKSCSIVQSK